MLPPCCGRVWRALHQAPLRTLVAAFRAPGWRLKRKPALPLLMAERVGAACAGCLNVELLQDLDREGDVPGSEDVVGAGGLVLLLGSREMA